MARTDYHINLTEMKIALYKQCLRKFQIQSMINKKATKS